MRNTLTDTPFFPFGTKSSWHPSVKGRVIQIDLEQVPHALFTKSGLDCSKIRYSKNGILYRCIINNINYFIYHSWGSPVFLPQPISPSPPPLTPINLKMKILNTQRFYHDFQLWFLRWLILGFFILILTVYRTVVNFISFVYVIFSLKIYNL